MYINLYSTDLCPKCQRPSMNAVIESHPTDRDLALQKFYCSECGPIKTKLISLKPLEPGPVIAA